MLKPLALLLLFAAATPVAAQGVDYGARQRDLVSLSRILGELHHIRRSCEASEEEIWRNRMRQLIELESPQVDTRNEMVAAFNDAFRRAEQRFPYCDRDARDYAAASAAEGEAVSVRLMAPLYDSLAQSGRISEAWENDDNQ